MLPSEAAPGMMRDPFVRFFMRMDEIHKMVEGRCTKCGDDVPCDTMRALWIYDLERRPQGGAN